MRTRVSLPPTVLSIALAAAGVALAIGTSLGAARAAASAQAAVTVESGGPVGVSDLLMGVTHVQHSADPWGNHAAVSRAWKLLRIGNSYQAQAIMGWGADNPEPSPGHYDWASLDGRVALIEQTGGTPVVTLCCAPDWMKGGRPGQTDWTKLENAPTPAHYMDFAKLAATVALRYPYVRYFQVWNELKGFWNNALNRWDYEGYTELYNDVYDAIKSVRPDALIGGPYVVLDSWRGLNQSDPSPVHGAWGRFDERDLDVVKYWLTHKHGADFIALDGSNGDNRDGRTTNGFRGCQAFAAAASWLRSLDPATYPGATTLPLVWSEWYATPDPTSKYVFADANATMASCLVSTLKSGAATVMIWGPQGDRRGLSFPEGLWTDTANAGGGMPTPYFYTHEAFHDYFGPGTAIYATKITGGHLTALASATHMLIINQSPQQRTVLVAGRPVRLGPYGVIVIGL